MQEIALPHVYIDDIWQTVLSIQKGAEAYAQKYSQSHTHLSSSVHMSLQFTLFATARSYLFLIYRPDKQTQLHTNTVIHKLTNAHNGRCMSGIYVGWCSCQRHI